MLIRTLVTIFLLVPAMSTHAAGTIDPLSARRVLLLHSFSRDFAPGSIMMPVFRTELAKQSASPIDFLDVSLQTPLFVDAGSETPLVEYLRGLLAHKSPDLIVAVGAPALNFLRQHKLFASVPVLVVGADKRRLRLPDPAGNVAAVGINLDLPGLVENILQVLPNTKKIEVVLGHSPQEKFWLAQFRRDFERFTDRVHFDWMSDLSFEEIRRRFAKLPQESAILYNLMLVDAAGVPYEQERTLDILQRESNAPIFGTFDSHFGRGIVGGPLYPFQTVGRVSAAVALRILNGESPANIEPVFFGPATPVYDWRELTRWKIDERRLFPGGIVQFRQPSVWAQYRWAILGVVAIIALQAASILGLLLQRARRRRAQADLRESQEFMELSTSAGELGLWVRGLEQGDLWVNQRLRSLFGFDQNDVFQFDDILARIHPDDRARVITGIEGAQRSGEPFKDEFRLVAPDCNERWLAVRGRTAAEPGTSHARRMGAVFDITERKRAEQALNAALVEIGSLKERLEEENIYLKEEISEVKGFEQIVGKSDALKYVLTRVEQVAKTDATVLLQGETGVGKELVARAIYENSSRSNGPYVRVNCATLPEALVESELFGHERGAFTGADRQRKGRFELADKGTILLDEAGELPAGTQAKLLRVLQEGEFERVGGSSTIKVNVRVIAATNRKLHEEVAAGRFRQDLFYRLNVYPITIPALRQRREDIPLLVNHHAREIGERLGKSITEVPAQVLREFVEYTWPGNIRELQNVIERAVIVSSDGVLRLPEPLTQTTSRPAVEEKPAVNDATMVSSMDDAEREHVLRALEATGWRINGPQGAAAMLKLHPSTLRFRIKKLGLTKVSAYTPTQKLNLR